MTAHSPTTDPDADPDELTRARLAAIVMSSADAIVGESLDGTITDWNPAAERLYGFTAAEAIGQPLSILASSGNPRELDDLLARVARGEHVAPFETIRRAKDGRLLDVSVSISPVRNASGQIIAASGIARDISALKRTQEALAASEQRFRIAFEDATIGMALVTPAGRIVQVNRAICHILGLTEAELLDTTFAELSHPDDLDIHLASLQRALAGEIRSYELEKRYVRRDGRVVWTNVCVSLVHDREGDPLYFIAQIQDVSERKAAEAEQSATHQRTREVLERITDGFYGLDREWRFTYLNGAAERFLGRSREDPGQRVWDAFAPAVETPIFDTLHQAMDQGVTTAVEFYYPPLAVWFEVRAYPSPGGLSVFFRDVTASKQLEGELREALQAAQAANRATGQFLAMMSHELRTPMQAVLGYADLLLANREGSLSADQLADVACIHQGAERMIALVDQMLDLSRMEAGRLDLVIEPVDLARIIEQVRQDIAPRAAAKGLDLRIELPADLPRILGDGPRLRQLLLNLAGNAVKFTDAGWVRISAHVDAAGVDVAVSDTGIGIAEEALPHIFDEFRQADSGTTRRYGGAGLGLAIARRLAEHHAGRISVISSPRAGSTFTLHLPAARIHPEATAASRSIEPPLAVSDWILPEK